MWASSASRPQKLGAARSGMLLFECGRSSVVPGSACEVDFETRQGAKVSVQNMPRPRSTIQQALPSMRPGGATDEALSLIRPGSSTRMSGGFGDRVTIIRN